MSRIEQRLKKIAKFLKSIGNDLSYADLRGANFTDANLRYVNFTGADLTGADLTDVTWERAFTRKPVMREAIARSNAQPIVKSTQLPDQGDIKHE